MQKRFVGCHNAIICQHPNLLFTALQLSRCLNLVLNEIICLAIIENGARHYMLLRLPTIEDKTHI